MNRLPFCLGALLALMTIPVHAQSTLLQAGPVTPGHAPMYVNSGSSQAIVLDGGGAGGGPIGATLADMGLTVRGNGTPPYPDGGSGPNGENFCDYDAPIDNPTGFHYLCLSPNAQGGGLISYGAGGTATQGILNFLINGAKYQFPGTGNGNVVGPTPTVIGDIPLWNDLTGTLLSDSGRMPPVGAFVGTTDAQSLTNKSITPIFGGGLTATGSSQGTAFPIAKSVNAFTTVALNTGAILPTTDPNGIAIGAGYTTEIINAGVNPIFVYPPSGQTIEGGSANVAVTVYENGDVHFVFQGSGAWYAR